MGVALCVLLWGARAFLASKYQIKYRVGGKVRRAWKRGTPDWIPRAVPWLEFFGWAGLLGAVAWWALHPVPVMGAVTVAIFRSRDVVAGCPRFRGVSSIEICGEAGNSSGR